MSTRRSGANHRGAMGDEAFQRPRRARGATATRHTPVSIKDRGPGPGLDEERLRALLGRQLGKFAIRVAQVAVTVQDESGPNGEPRVRATISVSHSRLGLVVVTASGRSSWAAAAAAVRSCERAVRRRVERKRDGRG